MTKDMSVNIFVPIQVAFLIVMGKSIRIDLIGRIDSNRFAQPNGFG